MKISYNWLKDFVDLDITPQKLAEQFTLKVAEVEDSQAVGQGLKKVVVGEILEIRAHPSADRLQIAKVSIGSDILEIVCGAKNIKVGQKVPTALIGAVLPGNFKIGERKIRGVASEGMLASGAELGLGEDSQGIMILDNQLEPGDNMAEVTGLADSVLEIDVLPDRSYLLSHIGVAREIAAIRNKDVALNKYAAEGGEVIAKSKLASSHRVQIMDPSLAPRYSLINLEGLMIGPSPAWLTIRLQHLGLRPVNNLVDLTNYVMLELGQPLHAFDGDKITGNKMVVRSAKKEESLKTLDGETHKLQPGMIVIADEKESLALGGVMGGEASEISSNTKKAVIEAANFDPLAVRKMAEKLKIRSEASLRFERGVDANLTSAALARLVELLPRVGLADAKVSQIVDEYPAPAVRQAIRFEPALIERMTGLKIDVAEQIRLLQSLGLSINESVEGDQRELLATPPSFRDDLTMPIDLVEEIARLHGYDKVPLSLPQTAMLPQPFDTIRHWSKKTKNILRGAGFTEIETYSFESGKELGGLKFDPRAYLELQNPPNPDQSYMRATLLPNALAAVKKNIANGVEAMRFFELGRTYRLARGEQYPFEDLRLLVVEVSKHSPKYVSESLSEWSHLGQIIESIIFHFGLDPAQLNKKKLITNKAYHHGRAAALSIGDNYIGDQAEIHPIALAHLGIDRRVTVLALDFDTLAKLSEPYRRYTPVPAFPSVSHDLSLIVEKASSIKEVIDLIKKAGGDLLVSVELFDKYSDKKLGENKSVSFHLIFRAKEKTLSDKQVVPLMEKISRVLTKKSVKIRS